MCKKIKNQHIFVRNRTAKWRRDLKNGGIEGIRVVRTGVCFVYFLQKKLVWKKENVNGIIIFLSR